MRAKLSTIAGFLTVGVVVFVILNDQYPSSTSMTDDKEKAAALTELVSKTKKCLEDTTALKSDPTVEILVHKCAGDGKLEQMMRDDDPDHPNAVRPFIANLAEEALQDAALTTVVAVEYGPVPGALICSDLSTWQVVVNQYVSAKQDAIQDQVTGGRSRLVRGESTLMPEPRDYGCRLITPGTEMKWNGDTAIAQVKVTLPDGTTFRGVTVQDMLRKKY